MFQFQPRWKEELVVTSEQGVFVLELPMGVLTAYMPPEAEWAVRAPAWAVPHWKVLKHELSVWCNQNSANLSIDPTATVTPVDA